MRDLMSKMHKHPNRDRSRSSVRADRRFYSGGREAPAEAPPLPGFNDPTQHREGQNKPCPGGCGRKLKRCKCEAKEKDRD